MFVRMTFKEYQRTHHRWYNPFTGLDSPVINKGKTDALSEDEVVKLFSENIFTDTLEFAICAVMFLSGLRRSEILALKPESLDWNTPKITVKNSWQRVDRKDKAYGPTKSKKERDAPFDPVLQGAIKKLWAENGRHKFVFCRKDGSTPGSSWIYVHFKKWLAAAKIDTAGRKIVPHSSRHSLASLLEARGIPLIYIQDLLGHYDLETTMGYLHSPNGTIRVVGQKITEAMEKGQEEAKNIIQFKTS
jgi:integrase/recombinase XerD